jgi:heme O synthase-like polyprenyltransferase
MNNKPKIYSAEIYFFLFFGLFHMHRIWGLIDRESYSRFWLSVMENRGWFYFALAGLLSAFCIMGMVIFFKNRGRNYWWRWIYIFGGGYLLFDLFAILIRLEVWQKLLYWMFDTSNPFWNILWGTFVGLGAFSAAIGLSIAKKLRQQSSSPASE